jgi:hypothetical protein
MAKENYRAIGPLTAEFINRFWSKTTRNLETGCVEWQHASFRRGYGSVNIRRRAFLAHRVAFFIGNGTDPIQSLVCHRCDNPRCCNPQHLFLGSFKDNTMDASTKGRLATGDAHPSRKPGAWQHVVGSRNVNSNLSEVQVLDIRRLGRENNLSLNQLARLFSVGKSCINHIVHRRSWQHI